MTSLVGDEGRHIALEEARAQAERQKIQSDASAVAQRTARLDAQATSKTVLDLRGAP